MQKVLTNYKWREDIVWGIIKLEKNILWKEMYLVLEMKSSLLPHLSDIQRSGSA